MVLSPTSSKRKSRSFWSSPCERSRESPKIVRRRRDEKRGDGCLLKWCCNVQHARVLYLNAQQRQSFITIVPKLIVTHHGRFHSRQLDQLFDADDVPGLFARAGGQDGNDVFVRVHGDGDAAESKNREILQTRATIVFREEREIVFGRDGFEDILERFFRGRAGFDFASFAVGFVSSGERLSSVFVVFAVGKRDGFSRCGRVHRL